MLGLLGKKIGMTQIFDEDGREIPVTVIELGPCYVMAVRTKEKSGYNAVQLGFEEVSEKRVSKPRLGQFKKVRVPALRHVREIRTDELAGVEVGQQLTVENFEVGDMVDVEGVSRGLGFQGVVKRHHFTGGRSGHGSMFGRVAGSIGASAYPSRVIKGMKMPGHMGNERVTTSNLKVVKVDAKNHLLAVRGSVPGTENGLVIVRTSLTRGKKRAWKVPASAAQAPEETPAPETKPEVSPEKA
jgi:large subunit ribosomal protein L3